MPRASILVLAVLLAGGCGRCTSKPTSDDKSAPEAGPPEPVTLPELPKPPAPWTFKPLRVIGGSTGVALPEGCTLRDKLVRATVKPTTRFVAATHALGALVIADAEGDPPELTGVAGVLLSPDGPSHDATPVPWTSAASMPRIARSGAGAWLSAFSEPGDGKLTRVLLYRSGKAELVAEGDRLAAVDLVCGEGRCALLTTRAATVAGPGADVWIGRAEEPVSSWRRVEILPAAGDSDAHPVGLARVDAAAGGDAAPQGSGVIVALGEGQEIAFFQADDPGGAREIGRVPAPHGVLDVAATPAPVALVYGNAIDEEGCAREGGKIRFERPGQPGLELRTHAPPLAGAIRPLGRGALATWLGPMGCGAPRKVVYAVVIDPAGKLVGSPMPVADAGSYAVAAQGTDVDLWIQHDEDVTWVRATCDAAGVDAGP
jgi:hypothetical protein